MDTSCNRVQDRNHDFVPQRLRRVEISPKWRCFNDNDYDNDDYDDNDGIKKDRTFQSPGIHGNAVWRDLYDIVVAGLWPTGCRSHMV